MKDGPAQGPYLGPGGRPSRIFAPPAAPPRGPGGRTTVGRPGPGRAISRACLGTAASGLRVATARSISGGSLPPRGVDDQNAKPQVVVPVEPVVPVPRGRSGPAPQQSPERLGPPKIAKKNIRSVPDILLDKLLDCRTMVSGGKAMD